MIQGILNMSFSVSLPNYGIFKLRDFLMKLFLLTMTTRDQNRPDSHDTNIPNYDDVTSFYLHTHAL